jgi:hypothetical protein
MVIDEDFFDVDSDRPHGLGNAAAERDFGSHPRMDSTTEPAFLSTRDLRWSRRLKTSDQAATL